MTLHKRQKEADEILCRLSHSDKEKGSEEQKKSFPLVEKT